MVGLLLRVTLFPKHNIWRFRIQLQRPPEFWIIRIITMKLHISPSIPKFVLTCLLLLSLSAWAEQNRIEKELRSSLQEKVVLLHGFYKGSTLRYDASGHLLENANSGYWASDGILQIADVSVEKHGTLLVVKGYRVISEFDADAGKFKNVRTKSSIKLLVALDPSSQDLGTVQTLLAKIFSTNVSTSLAETVPDYWKCWVSGRVTGDKAHGWQCSENGSRTATLCGSPEVMNFCKSDRERRTTSCPPDAASNSRNRPVW